MHARALTHPYVSIENGNTIRTSAYLLKRDFVVLVCSSHHKMTLDHYRHCELATICSTNSLSQKADLYYNLTKSVNSSLSQLKATCKQTV
jgi:hypothetical protein